MYNGKQAQTKKEKKLGTAERATRNSILLSRKKSENCQEQEKKESEIELQHFQEI